MIPVHDELRGHHVLLYDGVCGLCNRVNHLVLDRDPSGRFRFASLQGPFARAALEPRGFDATRLDTFYVIADFGTTGERVLSRARAALFVAGQLGGPWRLLRPLGILPTWLLDLGYRVVAGSRYRWFGKLPSCPVPSPSHRGRFIE